MIQHAIDKVRGHLADVLKVAHHPAVIQRRRLNRNRRLDTVAMDVATLSGMPHQPVTVTKVNILGNTVHSIHHHQPSLRIPLIQPLI